MTTWNDYIPVIVAVLAFFGGLFGHLVTRRKNKTELQLAMIDQIQEERDRLDGQLKEQREYHDKQMAAQQTRHDQAMEKMNVRISGFYADKSASRRYIKSLEMREAELIAHIYSGKPPPPPGASPIPPDGYVP